MDKIKEFYGNLGMRTKLIVIFLVVKIIPLILIVVIAWTQFSVLSESLQDIAVKDSADALNASAIENIERMSTDTAMEVADFLYERDDDILYLSKIDITEENLREFINSKRGRTTKEGVWELAPDGKSWVQVKTPESLEYDAEKEALDIIQNALKTNAEIKNAGSLERKLSEADSLKLRELGLSNEKIMELVSISSNKENDEINSGASFNYRLPDNLEYENIPLYDEITYIDLNGNELIKVVSDSSSKKNYPMSKELKDVSKRENTYVKAETYFEDLKKLKPGEIYVSDVIGAYIGANYIGMYAPEVLKALKDAEVPHVNAELLNEVGNLPADEFEEIAGKQAFAGKENPNGQRFEGIIRWATPVTDENNGIIGYITFALNHDNIMEFVDHITPTNARYTELTSAFEGNYAFIWDYKCRSICHPRHNSIAGFDPQTGEPQIPWLETSIYEAWQASGIKNWVDFINTDGIKSFDNQSRTKKPAAALTKQGLVGLDGRYLNNAPQCTGWMDLTKDGGSGSFYILWSGLYKLTTAAAIPYYTGHYAPSEENGFSKRGFGFVAIGAGLEDFQKPSKATEIKLTNAASEVTSSMSMWMIYTTIIMLVVIILVAIWMSSFLTNNITKLIAGISRFREGERQFRFNSPARDEFGTLADSFDDMADSIVASVGSPLNITDMSRKIIYMNEYALNLCETSLAEAVGNTYDKISVYPYKSKYCPITALEENRTSEVHYLEAKDRYMQGAADYLLDKNNNKIGYIITSTDVTDMIKTQIKLEQAVNDANEASKHKGDFLARMSHEIRTPMNAIIGLANIVRKKLEDIINGNSGENKKIINQTQEIQKIQEIKEVKNEIDRIETSSQHLLGLLNDILDITKIESGKIDITEEKTEFSKFINTVTGIIKPRYEEKNIKFIITADSFEREAYIVDALRLRQVLINLLGNAVKFTQELGTIEFKIKKKDRQDGKTLIEFSVIDTGMGIPDDKQAKIFEPFEQGDGKTTRQFGGTGLGLAISRSIVQLMGGDITLASKLGEGSEFTFAIWLNECQFEAAETEIRDATNKFTDKKALLVDDVDINRMIVVSMLEDTGIEIDEAEDGIEALQKFKDSADGTYDIIFMDIQMPNMDGYECAERIRQLNRNDAKTIPIIALTANAFKDDIDKAVSAGMNAHIAKPIEFEVLTDSLFKFLKR